MMCMPTRSAFEPHVPAAIVVAIVHAGEDCARLPAAAELDPHAHREALVRFKIADVGQLERRSLFVCRLPLAA